jgi:lysophospholipase L1-like esterase
MTKLKDHAVVVFQGDGTTDHGRDRDNPNDLGGGYALMTAGWFSALYPQKRVTFYNRGTAGARVKDLVERWDADCLDLSPTWVSILIGVNNTRRRFDQNDPTTMLSFEHDYRILLDRTLSKPAVKIITMEPFMLVLNDQQVAMRLDLDEKIEVVRRLAREFDTIHIPLDSIFAEAATLREAEYWLYDGVLLTNAGAALIAQSWLKVVEAI